MLELPAVETYVVADPTELHQILINLCTNAGQAMRDNGGQLFIKLDTVRADEILLQRHHDLKTGLYMVISVTDTGPGILKDVQDRIFEPFFTTKGQTGGTGLGLSVVHGIVQELEGDITLYSEPSQGSTFNVYLPVAGLHHPDQQAAADNEIPRGSERILLVDDEIMLVEMLGRTLGSLGYIVEKHHESTRALAAFQANPCAYDIVITDQTMPVLTGLELARKIIDCAPQTPVVLITGISHAASRERAMENGIRAYISKPVSRKELAITLRQVLDQAYLSYQDSFQS